MPPNTRIASNDTVDKREKRMKYFSEIFLFGSIVFGCMFFIFLGVELFGSSDDVAYMATINSKRKLALLFQLLCVNGFMVSEYVKVRGGA